MNVPSFYQDEAFQALVASGQVDLRVIFARELPADRKQLGWHSETGSYKQQTLPRSLAALPRAAKIAWNERDRVHIVNGIWAESAFAAALVVLAVTGSRFAIYSEAPTPQIERARGKRLLRSAFGHWIATRRNAYLFPIARFAEQFYQSLGFRPELTYPFAYFRLRAKREGPLQNKSNEHTDMIYVGQLIPRKGIDVLLSAMAPICVEFPKLHLTLVGDGPARSELAAQASSLGISDRVTFAGVIPSLDVRQWIGKSDLLVLPSRWDGWGLVVNEAFSMGVPVIVSDRCGAADIVDHGRNGYIFQSEDVSDLQACLRRFLSAHPNTLMETEALRMGELMSAEQATAYLIQCLRHVNGDITEKPVAPWALPQFRRELSS
jgi:glycosyltransferase involved in cell wall biosynthesis